VVSGEGAGLLGVKTEVLQAFAQKPSLLLPTKRKVGLLSAGEFEQLPLVVSLPSNQHGRIFGDYYTRWPTREGLGRLLLVQRL